MGAKNAVITSLEWGCIDEKTKKNSPQDACHFKLVPST